MDVINLIIYIAIALSGTVFGSFFTLAVHRIPKGQDITHERSYCPNCNHKLNFLDLIPVWSYIFLGAKCRYCKQKIRPRYLILEICSGLVFVLLALSHKINFESTMHDYILFAFDVLFLCCIFITAGIDKETKKIPDSVMIYGTIIALFKTIYNVCSLKSQFTDRVVVIDEVFFFLEQWVLCMVIPAILILVDYICAKLLKKNELEIGLDDIKYLMVLGLYFLSFYQMLGFILSTSIILIYLIVYVIINFVKSKKNKQLNLLPKEIPLGFFMSIAYTIVMLLVSF